MVVWVGCAFSEVLLLSTRVLRPSQETESASRSQALDVQVSLLRWRCGAPKHLPCHHRWREIL